MGERTILYPLHAVQSFPGGLLHPNHGVPLVQLQEQPADRKWEPTTTTGEQAIKEHAKHSIMASACPLTTTLSMCAQVVGQPQEDSMQVKDARESHRGPRTPLKPGNHRHMDLRSRELCRICYKSSMHTSGERVDVIIYKLNEPNSEAKK